MAGEHGAAATAGPMTGPSQMVSLRQWYMLAVLTLVYTLNIADRYVITTVMESIRLDLHLTDSAVALLTGTVLALFYVVAGIPISALADRYSRRNIIAAALVIWSALTVMTGLSRGFWTMLAARVGVGVGEAGGTPPSTSILSDCFPPRQRTFVYTIWALGASLGAWLGADIAGRVADLYGWRAAFLAMGVPGVIMGIVIFTTMREPVRGRMDGDDQVSARIAIERAQQKVPMLVALRAILTQPATLHLMMGGAVTALWGWGLMWWTPTYLQRAYHMTAGQAGAMLGPMHLIAGTLAIVGTGALMAHPAMADPKRVLWMMAGFVGLVTVPSFFVYWTHDLGTARICLWILVPAMYSYLGPSFALLQNVVPPQMRAMASAVTLLMANIANLVIAPQFVGLVSDHMIGQGLSNAESLRFALMLLAPTGFWAAYHYWAAIGKIDSEAERMRAAIA